MLLAEVRAPLHSLGWDLRNLSVLSDTLKCLISSEIFKFLAEIGAI